MLVFQRILCKSIDWFLYISVTLTYYGLSNVDLWLLLILILSNMLRLILQNIGIQLRKLKL